VDLYVIGLFLTLSIPHTLELAFGLKQEHTNWRKTQRKDDEMRLLRWRYASRQGYWQFNSLQVQRLWDIRYPPKVGGKVSRHWKIGIVFIPVIINARYN
jgi:hypothetical protein